MSTAVLTDARAWVGGDADEEGWIVVDEAHDLSPIIETDETDFASLFAWATELDEGERLEMLDELRSAVAEGRPWEPILHAWRVTAESLSDPLRRAVLLGEFDLSDFEDAFRPE